MPRDSRTVVQLFNVPWDAGYRNLRYFASASARDAWFDSRAKEQVVPHNDGGNVTVYYGSPVFPPRPYVVAQNWDALHNWNYMRFKNNAYPNPTWQYAFINYMEDVGEHQTMLHYTIDSWINNIGRMHIQPCLVERMHTPSDAVTYEAEPFNINAYVTKFNASLATSSSTLEYLFFATTDPEGNSPVKDEDFATIDGDKQALFVRSGDFLNMRLWLNRFADGGHLNNVVAIIAYPQNYLSVSGTNTASFTNPHPSGITVTRDTGTYKPRNKKCLHYPYCYCLVSDKQKSSRAYHWEDGGGKLKFTFSGSVGISGAMTLTPQFADCDYQFLEDMSISIGYPAAFSGNGYANWLASNQATIQAQQTNQAIGLATSAVASIGSVAATAATGGAAAPAAIGAGMSLFSQGLGAVQTANSISAQMEAARYIPVPSQVPSGAVNFLSRTGRLGFTAYSVYPRKKEFEALDSFFDRYGYAINKVRSVDPTVRSAYSYYKTAGATVTGQCPQTDREVIMSALDRGLTFWRNDNIGDYSQTNN